MPPFSPEISGGHLFLTATGAWYTAGDQTSHANQDAKTYVLNDFVTITASGEETSSIIAYTKKDANGNGTFEAGERTAVPVDADTKYYLFPEDEIEVVAGGEYKIEAAQMSTDDNNVDFWYKVIVTGTATDVTYGNGASNNSVVHFVAGTSSTMLVSFRTVPVVTDSEGALEDAAYGEGHVVRDGNGIYTYKVESSLNKGAAGKTFTIAISGAGIEIRAIQYNNISAAEAAYMLGDGWVNANTTPAAKAAPAQQPAEPSGD